MAQPAPLPKRARTDGEKAARRRTILEAAESLFAAVGFEAFSMNALAERVGVAKGTLYLYFRTREEVLLALHLEKLNAWRQALVNAVGRHASDSAFARAFYATAYEEPTLLPLLSRLDSVIEHNVPLPVLIEAKREMTAQIEVLVDALAGPLDLSRAQTFDAVTALASLLLGAAQVDLGPRIDRRRLPDDVKRMTDAFSSEPLFVTNARRILRGIRAGE